MYFGGEKVNAVTCVLAAQDLARLPPWFSASVRNRMLRVEEFNDLMPAVRQKVHPWNLRQRTNTSLNRLSLIVLTTATDEMPKSTPDRTQENADRLLRGGSHPVLAAVALFASFLLAVLPFAFDTDNFLVVTSCLVACFSCFILFMRLLIGHLGLIKWILLGVAAYLGYIAGEQWHSIAFLAGGTLLCSYLLARLIGDFVPVIRNVKF